MDIVPRTIVYATNAKRTNLKIRSKAHPNTLDMSEQRAWAAAFAFVQRNYKKLSAPDFVGALIDLQLSPEHALSALRMYYSEHPANYNPSPKEVEELARSMGHAPGLEEEANQAWEYMEQWHRWRLAQHMEDRDEHLHPDETEGPDWKLSGPTADSLQARNRAIRALNIAGGWRAFCGQHGAAPLTQTRWVRIYRQTARALPELEEMHERRKLRWSNEQ